MSSLNQEDHIRRNFRVLSQMSHVGDILVSESARLESASRRGDHEVCEGDGGCGRRAREH